MLEKSAKSLEASIPMNFLLIPQETSLKPPSIDSYGFLTKCLGNLAKSLQGYILKDFLWTAHENELRASKDFLSNY